MTDEKSKIGRPEKPIDWKVFEELCDIQCTHEELSSVLKISRPTLYSRAEKQYDEDFPTLYKRLTDAGKTSLRRDQLKMAKKNCSMAIWLGKQYLGQREPEAIQNQNTVPNQLIIDQATIIMNQQNEIEKLKAERNASQCQTSKELLGSDSPL